MTDDSITHPRWQFVVVAALVLCCCTSNPRTSLGCVGTGEPSKLDATAEVAGRDAAATDGDAGGCPRWGDGRATGSVAAASIDEASGIVASAHNPSIYWLHNDSGDSARTFAVTDKGALRATVTFDTATPADIEDMAISDESPDTSYLYFGDIGDNGLARGEMTIHRVTEPRLGGTATIELTVTSEKMRFVYPDGPRDAETLLFDPIEKELFIATKRIFGASEIHRVGKFAAGTRVTTEMIATVPLTTSTGGEISRDGRYIAIRNYSDEAFLWVRRSGESIAGALARRPCKLPVAREPQGEAFAFLPDSRAYVTISEGASPALHVTPLR